MTRAATLRFENLLQMSGGLAQISTRLPAGALVPKAVWQHFGTSTSISAIFRLDLDQADPPGEKLRLQQQRVRTCSAWCWNGPLARSIQDYLGRSDLWPRPGPRAGFHVPGPAGRQCNEVLLHPVATDRLGWCSGQLHARGRPSGGERQIIAA